MPRITRAALRAQHEPSVESSPTGLETDAASEEPLGTRISASGESDEREDGKGPEEEKEEEERRAPLGEAHGKYNTILAKEERDTNGQCGSDVSERIERDQLSKDKSASTKSKNKKSKKKKGKKNDQGVKENESDAQVAEGRDGQYDEDVQEARDQSQDAQDTEVDAQDAQNCQAAQAENSSAVESYSTLDGTGSADGSDAPKMPNGIDQKRINKNDEDIGPRSEELQGDDSRDINPTEVATDITEEPIQSEVEANGQKNESLQSDLELKGAQEEIISSSQTHLSEEKDGVNEPEQVAVAQAGSESGEIEPQRTDDPDQHSIPEEEAIHEQAPGEEFSIPENEDAETDTSRNEHQVYQEQVKARDNKSPDLLSRENLKQMAQSSTAGSTQGEPDLTEDDRASMAATTVSSMSIPQRLTRPIYTAKKPTSSMTSRRPSSLRSSISTKPLTRPSSVELPGDVFARRAKQAREEALRREAEEEKRRRDFKARPYRPSLAPSHQVKTTTTSSARERLSQAESSKRTSEAAASSGGRPAWVGTGGVTASTSSRKDAYPSSSLSSSGRGSARSSVASATALKPYNLSTTLSADRRKKEEREELAKKARADAAARSRQASREWAERRKQRENATASRP